MLEVDVTLKRGEFDLQMKFAAPSGSVIALFGPSGCGKSTTANLIAGLLNPATGRIVVGNDVLFDSIQHINVPAEQRGIGYVFQNARLFPHLSVRSNLMYGSRRTRNQHFVDFDFVAKLLDLQSLLQRHPKQLSGGEQQRVAIGRALLSQPRLLLLDEPLSSLDIARRNEVLPYLERLRDSLKIPMLYVSHQFEEVLRLATHVVLMQNGRCLSQGSLNTLSLQPELRNMLGDASVGAVIDSHIVAIDAAAGLAQIAIGDGTIHIEASGLEINQRMRVQLLARDLILSLNAPTGLSIRNNLHGAVTALIGDGNTTLVYVDVGGAVLLARITLSATREMKLQIGTPLWVLVKAVTLRGHVFATGEHIFAGNE